MTARGCVAIVDAFPSGRRLQPLFAAAGYECVHVQSSPVLPPALARYFQPDQYVTNVVHTGDLQQTLRTLAEVRPVHVLPGIETGVELADLITESFGLVGNGTAGTAARRDKYRMVETVKAAGLCGADQILVRDEASLLEWYERVGGRVVVKPLNSSGSDGVSFCDTAAEVAGAAKGLLRATNALNFDNTAIVGQRYLYGTEYYVNTVSRDGRHHVCDIWRTTKVSANGVLDLMENAYLMPREGPEQDLLVPYVFAVLDALGIRHGPAHTELKLTPDGPCIIETGARVCGGDLPYLVEQATGESQLNWTIDAYLNPERFSARAGQPYRLSRYVACVSGIAPRSGTLRGYPRTEQVRQLESFHDLKMIVRPGDRLLRTVDDLTKPYLVDLFHEVQEVVLRDHLTIRQLDGEDFYDVD
jgi:biotin carboxylase